MASGDYLVSDADLALLRSPAQAYTIRAVFFPSYTPTVTQWTKPSGSGRTAIGWTPDASIGPNRVGLVGVAVSFYLAAAGRSGGFIGAANQSIDWGDGSGAVSPVSGEVSHAYSAAGLYEVVFTAHDPTSGVTFAAHRWVRVFADWSSAYDGIAEVSSLAGSASQGGWTASLTVRKSTGDYQTGDVPDRAGVLLYLEEEWNVDHDRGTSTKKTIGRSSGYRYEPEVLFFGYVLGNTVREDPESASVAFSAQTAEALLQPMTLRETRFLDATQAGYGLVATGLQFSDVANYVAYQMTNWGKWHSCYAWRESWPSPSVYKTIVLNEGSIWQALQSFATNEFGRLQSDRHSGLFVRPNVNARGFSWWGSVTDPPMLPFDRHNCFSVEVTETQPHVSGVELQAANPIRGTVLKAKFPSDPGDVGDRYVQTDLTCEVQANLDAWAERLFYWQNARYRVSVTTGLPMMLDVGDFVIADYADSLGRVDLTASVGGGAYRKPFYLESISYSPSVDSDSWQTSYELSEIVRTRWNLTLHRWEVLDGGTSPGTWEAA